MTFIKVTIGLTFWIIFIPHFLPPLIPGHAGVYPSCLEAKRERETQAHSLAHSLIPTGKLGSPISLTCKYGIIPRGNAE
jgi:hypothetical protein